jgi:hypothetical protein
MKMKQVLLLLELPGKPNGNDPMFDIGKHITG